LFAPTADDYWVQVIYLDVNYWQLLGPFDTSGGGGGAQLPIYTDTSADGIIITENGAGGVNLVDNGAGGINLSSSVGGTTILNTGGGVSIQQVANAPITLRNTGNGVFTIQGDAGSAGLAITDASSGGVNINTTGSGAMLLTDSTSGGEGITLTSANGDVDLTATIGDMNLTANDGTITIGGTSTGVELVASGIDLTTGTSGGITITGGDPTMGGAKIVVSDLAALSLTTSSADIDISTVDGTTTISNSGTGNILINPGSGGLAFFGASAVGKQVSGGTAAGAIAGLVALGLFSS
jgi:hypothetical protein